MLVDILPSHWLAQLSDTLDSAEGHHLSQRLQTLLESGEDVFPARSLWFAALRKLTASSTRVLILGQDPYHGPGQATGHAFAVKSGIQVPPSLRNIFKLIEAECSSGLNAEADLALLEKQGVMLLNSVLTVSQGKPGSHADFGWQVITDRIIRVIAEDENPTVFILWGAHAQKKAQQISGDQNLVLAGPHPSPLSAYRGFFESGHLTAANDFLRAKGAQAIDWTRL